MFLFVLVSTTNCFRSNSSVITGLWVPLVKLHPEFKKLRLFRLFEELLFLKAHCCSLTNFNLIFHSKFPDMTSLVTVATWNGGRVFFSIPLRLLLIPSLWYGAEA